MSHGQPWRAARVLLVLLCLASTLAVPSAATPVLAADPTSVTLAGSLQSELGCPDDWLPACATTHLADQGNGVWRGEFTVPAGSYEYKMALNDAWDESYAGNHRAPNGNTTLVTDTTSLVRFYYDHKTHAVLDSAMDEIAVAAGSFQSEIGCPDTVLSTPEGDWAPDCVRSLLTDVDGDGIYTFVSESLPAGNYAFKVAFNEQWNGAQPSGDVPFSVPAAGRKVTITWNSATNEVGVTVAQGAFEPGDNNIAFNGLFHDSRDTAYRYPGGATPISTTVTLRFQTNASDVQGVKLRTFRDTSGRPGSGETVYDMQRVVTNAPCISGPTAGQSCDYWETQLNSGAKSTLYYRFIVTDGTRTVFYEDNTDNNNAGTANIGDGGAGVARDTSPDASWAINVYDPTGYTVIPWTRDGVYYQIFPDRFRNGDQSNDPNPSAFRYNYPTPEDGSATTAANDQIQRRSWNTLPEGNCRAYRNADGTAPACPESPRGRDYYGGDLRGVIEKLPYLQELGVTIVYFNPVFAAGSNHRYDTRDYFKVDPSLGTLQEFKELLNAAHARGMYVVLDGVFNHLSSDSAIFDRYRHYAAVGACESADSPYRSWFYFRPPSSGQPAPCAPSAAGGANTYYDGWFGFDSIPVINKNLSAVQSYFYSATLSLDPGMERNVALYWLAQGIDGWRLDVASDPSFPENYWRDFRSKVKGYKPNAVIIGEMWKKFEHLPYLQGDKMDGVQGYRTRDAVLGFIGRGASDNKGFAGEGQAQSASQFADKLLSVIEDYAPATLHSTMNELGTHDTARLRWLLTPGANNREARELDAANVAIGVQRQRLAALTLFSQPMPPGIYYGDEVGVTGYDDPDDRRTMPWNDPYRLFLPVVAKTEGGNPTAPGTPLAADGLSAAADRSMYAFYKNLAAQRRAHPALRTGELDVLLADDARNVIAYSRSTITDTALIVMNAGDITQTVTIPLTSTLRNGLVLSDTLGSLGQLTTANGGLAVTLGPRRGALLVPTPGQDITPPGAPNVSIDGRGDGSVSLRWAAVAGAASYRVYRSRLSHGGYELVTTTPITGTTFSDSGLVNGVPYYYVVVALDAAGNEGAWSNEVSGVPAFPLGYANVQFPPSASVTVGTGSGGAVTVYIQVYAAGHTEAAGPDPAIIAQLGYGITGTNVLTWTWLSASYNVQAGNNDEYQAEIRPRAAGDYAYLARFSSDGGATWFYGDVDGSTTGQLAGDGGNRPGALTVIASPDTTPPPAPIELTATNGGPSAVALQWASSPAADIYAYNLFRSTTAGGPYTQVGGDLPASTTAYTDTTVTSGVAYFYVLRAVDTSFNASGNSNEATATPAPRTVSVTFNVSVADAATSGIAEGDKLYITGNPASILCGFCDPQTVALTKNSLTSWTVTLSNVPENTKLEYKYTLGTFTNVEKDATCGEINNRQLTATYGAGGAIAVNDTVPRFRNRAGCPN